MAITGYSGTPLGKKLGLKEGFIIYLVNPPSHYLELLTDLPGSLQQSEDPKQPKDFIHFFTKSKVELENKLPKLKLGLRQNGSIWVSWPKKAAKVATDLDGNIVRKLGLSIGLVDVKVCAVDQTWSGLKFMIPVKDRI